MRVTAYCAFAMLAIVSLFTTNSMRANDEDRQKSPAKRVAEPGPQHQNLNTFIGTWQVNGKCWKDDKAGESVSGTVNSEWVLGKRFVQCRVHLTEGGEAFEGIGMTGHDNAQDKFVSSWQDTKCTGIKTETGDYDPASKTYTFTGEFKDENGKTVKCRRLINVASENEHIATGYLTEPGQPERKVAEMTFTRSGR